MWLTESDLRDLGGADLLGYLVARQASLCLNYEWRVYTVFCVDRVRYLRSIYCIVHLEVSQTERCKLASDLAVVDLHDCEQLLLMMTRPNVRLRN